MSDLLANIAIGQQIRLPHTGRVFPVVGIVESNTRIGWISCLRELRESYGENWQWMKSLSLRPGVIIDTDACLVWLSANPMFWSHDEDMLEATHDLVLTGEFTDYFESKTRHEVASLRTIALVPFVKNRELVNRRCANDVVNFPTPDVLRGYADKVIQAFCQEVSLDWGMNQLWDASGDLYEELWRIAFTDLGVPVSVPWEYIIDSAMKRLQIDYSTTGDGPKFDLSSTARGYLEDVQRLWAEQRDHAMLADRCEEILDEIDGILLQALQFFSVASSLMDAGNCLDYAKVPELAK